MGRKDFQQLKVSTQTRTYGQVRCHNPSCMGRLEPKAWEAYSKMPGL